MSIVQIAMITDVNFATTTAVAMESFIEHKKPDVEFNFHIICADLTDQAENMFRRFVSDQVKVSVHRVSNEPYLIYQEIRPRVKQKISALYKFTLSDILPDLDKVLYIDGDVIACGCLSEIYEIDLKDKYAAVVRDGGAMYKNFTVASRVKYYFNSGMMLLNLALIRKEHVPEKLMQTFLNLDDAYFLDQDPFNIVFENRTILLPVKYNCPRTIFESFHSQLSIQTINDYYGTHYANKKEMFRDALIFHYITPVKPWVNDSVAAAAIWKKCYWNTPLDDHTLFPKPEEHKEKYMVSVVIPCYNTANFIEQALDSVFNQTYQDFEVICADNCSADNTLSILERYQAQHPNMTVLSGEKRNVGYQCNRCTRLAQGKYIYYLDSNDYIEPETFEKAVDYAETLNLDVVYFEGAAFYDPPSLKEKFPDYASRYQISDAYPGCYSGNDFYSSDTKSVSTQPCLRLTRLSFLRDAQISFSKTITMNDRIQSLSTVFMAKRCGVLPFTFFHRRIRESSIVASPLYFSTFLMADPRLVAMISMRLLYTAAKKLKKYWPYRFARRVFLKAKSIVK